MCPLCVASASATARNSHGRGRGRGLGRMADQVPLNCCSQLQQQLQQQQRQQRFLTLAALHAKQPEALAMALTHE